jgi:acyl dehydratase
MGKKYEVKPFSGPPEETLDFSTVENLVGKFSPLRDPHDEVSESDIRHWCEVTQDTNPLYRDTEYARNSEYGGMIAPPTMVQTWSLGSMRTALNQFVDEKLAFPEDPNNQLTEKVVGAGYIGVMATAQEQTFQAPIKPGDTIYYKIGIGQVSDHDHFTRQGVGRYYTIVYTFENQNGEQVCFETFRVLVYKPPISTRKLYEG